ncbi:iron-sulfur cluster assembly accessory protein [Candidatus Woesearchaeota archaeon]|nr:MAG: hypothetical protein QT09_C0012G0039 [archaeon GW2011_AR18]MBS3161373.1 iron-sulfur cluster assembly accessory protein [Candidatus Woesearchaeota archaeon]HIH25405.1 iron-sulfur cluster assembly accessory protein [Nanoarchaeota archaeon]
MVQSQTQLISKDLPIGEFVERFSSVIDVLTDEGVHCVGCGASTFETIEQGLMSHGKSVEEVDEFINRVNNVYSEREASRVNNKPSDDLDVIITDKAAIKLKDILKSQNKESYSLRVQVLKGGCSGNKYGFQITDVINVDDKVYNVEGVKFLVDASSLKLLNGSKVDYVDSLQGAGFKISNPNAKKSCGCGESFN